MCNVCSDVSDRFAEALSFSLNQLGLPHLPLIKEEQRLAVKAIYEGRGVFVWLPTGYGKSLCYQTIPFVTLFAATTALHKRQTLVAKAMFCLSL